MEMHQIRYFLAVCDTLNFTRAAAACHVTQPALTRAIQKLEEELGGLLFRRERAQTHLTDLGHLIRPQLDQVLRQSMAAQQAARAFLKLDNASFRLGVMCTIGPLRFMPFLGGFSRRHPGIDMTLIEGASDRLCDRLHSGDLDVAVMARPGGFGERADAALLYEERFAVALPLDHPLAAREAIRFAELNGEAYLSRINCEHASLLDEVCERAGANLKVAYASEREDWILTMVAAGLGIAMVPEFSARLPDLAIRPLVEPVVRRRVSLVSLAGRRFSPPVRTFVQAIRAYDWPRAPDLALVA